MFATHPEMFVFVFGQRAFREGATVHVWGTSPIWKARVWPYDPDLSPLPPSPLPPLSLLLVYLFDTHRSLLPQAISWPDSDELVVLSSSGFPSHTSSCPSSDYQKTPQKIQKKETILHQASDASIGPHLCWPTSQTVSNKNQIFLHHDGVYTDPVDLNLAAGEAWASRIQPCSLECREVLHSLTASHARWSNPWSACSQTWPDTLASFEILRDLTSKTATKPCCRRDLQDHDSPVCSR